ncbi:MAG: hypothetical protein J6B61_03215 [Romboutsia sp.]|nr:hypothetical protein [Romboutsia sp.]
MLDRLREELMEKQAIHEELVKKYDEKVALREELSSELMQIEKQIIHNQGAMEAINKLGVEIMEKESATEEVVESVPAETVEIVQ